MTKRGEKFLKFLKSCGNQVTLGQVQKAFKNNTVAYSMTQCVSEARAGLPKNKKIKCYRKGIPSKNLYVLEAC